MSQLRRAVTRRQRTSCSRSYVCREGPGCRPWLHDSDLSVRQTLSVDHVAALAFPPGADLFSSASTLLAEPNLTGDLHNTGPFVLFFAYAGCTARVRSL